MKKNEIIEKISELAKEALKCDSSGYPNWDSYFEELLLSLDSFVDDNIKDERTHKKIYNIFYTEAENISAEVLKNVVKEKFTTLPFGMVVGVQHVSLPYEFKLLYVIENVDTVSEIKDKLATVRVKPFPYGVMANYNDWANIDFVVVDNYDEIDLDYLVVLASQEDYEYI